MPAQCPECARFLSQAFVAGLAVEPTACPKCGRELTAADFPDRLGQAAAPEGPREEPAGAADLRHDQSPDELGPGEVPGRAPTADVPTDAATGSVRPPDLDPTDVRGEDPLAGWDESAEVHDLDNYRAGRLAPPPDGAIVAGAGLFGALLGVLLSRRRGIGALIGAIVGVVAGGAARQVWRLED